MRRAPVILLVLFMAAPAWAVYRCQVGNRVVYQDTPCETGAIAKSLPKADAPPRSEQLRARARALREEAAVLNIRIGRARQDQEMRKRAECVRRERDVRWTEITAAKYKDDLWWRNQAENGRERYLEDCR